MRDLEMSWYVKFKNNDNSYRLAVIEKIEIKESVESLADTATITLPESAWNDVLKLENKIKRGTQIIVQLGYDRKLETEFVGYVQKITNDGSLIIHCEDALFLFRKSVPDIVLKPTTVKKIAEYLIKHVDRSFTLKCDYDIPYEKFTIHQATGYDVLKKLQDEIKGNIYFDTETKILHIHPPFVEKGGEAVYSMHLNVENSSLEYKESIDKQIEVTVESVDINGKVRSVTVGNTGGDKVTIKIGHPMSEDAMKKVAESALLKRNFNGYEGSFDTWLVPFVKPSYSILLSDRDYLYKKGNYYVVSVDTTFDENGGKRTITPGIKLN